MDAITAEKNKLGFVGVGYMGRPIAQRLLKSGFQVAAYDRNRSNAEELIRYGGTVAPGVAELSSSCDVVLSCLASDEAVLHVDHEQHAQPSGLDLARLCPSLARTAGKGKARGCGQQLQCDSAIHGCRALHQAVICTIFSRVSANAVGAHRNGE